MVNVRTAFAVAIIFTLVIRMTASETLWADWPIHCDPEVAGIAFRNKMIDTGYAKFETNPYTNQTDASQSHINQILNNKVMVCAIRYLDLDHKTYSINTFDSKIAAEQNGFTVTHQGQCGACSSLQDLSVYLTLNLTEPVRKCGEKSFFSKKWAKTCISNLGFTDQCSDIWLFNVGNTRKDCLSTCLWATLTGQP